MGSGLEETLPNIYWASSSMAAKSNTALSLLVESVTIALAFLKECNPPLAESLTSVDLYFEKQKL